MANPLNSWIPTINHLVDTRTLDIHATLVYHITKNKPKMLDVNTKKAKHKYDVRINK